jgi:hypothetical protein
VAKHRRPGRGRAGRVAGGHPAGGVQLGQQAVDGGDLLEPLSAKAHGRDPGGGGAEDLVAVELPGVAGDPQGVGLAGAGLADDHLDAGAALGDVADHRGLLAGDRRMRPERFAHGLVGGHGGLLAGAVDRRGDQPLLGREQLGSGVAALAGGVLGHHADDPLGEEAVGQPLQFGRRGGGELAAESDQDLAAGEGGGVGGQPLGAGELVEGALDGQVGHRRLAELPAGDLPHQPLGVQAALAGLLPPAPIQRLGGLVGLGRAGGMRHVLHQPAGAGAPVCLQALQLGW